MKTVHNRFKRKVWAFKSDFTGALAKWLVKQSPYDSPKDLSICIEKYSLELDNAFNFDANGMVEINLVDLTSITYDLLESIPEVMALNERKNGRDGPGFVSRFDGAPDSDDEFIDIMAVAQNITCEFADSADAQAYLNAS